MSFIGNCSSTSCEGEKVCECIELEILVKEENGNDFISCINLCKNCIIEARETWD